MTKEERLQLIRKRKREQQKRMMYAGAALAFLIIIVIIIIASCNKKTDSKLEETTTVSMETTALATEPQTTEQETTVEETTVYYEPASVSLIAVGDNLIHIDFSNWAMKTYGEYVFDSIYRDVKSMIEPYDIAILNQEVPVAAPALEVSNYPSFNAPCTIIDAAYNAGFNVLSMATNHTLDQGTVGAVISLDYIHQKFPDILTTGAYATKQDRDQIPIMEVNGLKIAVLNYTYGSNSGFRDDFWVNQIDNDLMMTDVAAARAQADFVIACVHWGLDGTAGVTHEQMTTAALLCELGVDLIIGTHPHIMQEVKYVTSSSGHKTLIYYSLGNFIGMQHYSESLLGGVAKVNIVRDTDGTVRIDSYDLDYVVTQWGEQYSDPRTIPWSMYTRELAAQHNMISYDSRFSFDLLEYFISRVEGLSDLSR